jgi:trigger factor
MPGFRPGHVPLSLMKQRFGKDAMGEVLERSVNQAIAEVVREQKLRPSLAPKAEIIHFEDGKDLEFSLKVELMPDVPEIDFAALELDAPHHDVPDEEIEETLARIAASNRKFNRRGEGEKAEKGDRAVIDFTGRIDGVAFEGGAGKRFPLELGSGQFIPGFEDQLIGAQEGEERIVSVSFPEHYQKKELAGKPSEFTVKVHELHQGEATVIDDDFAKSLGFADLATLREQAKERLGESYSATGRIHLKKQLFDLLEKNHDFPIPQGMRDLEFANIWKNIEEARKEGDEELAGKSDEELKREYGRIADRRVKLGILLSDIAVKNDIRVTQDELGRAVLAEARRYPGQERKVLEHYKKTPKALEALRGPILEEKAVDFILDKVKRNVRSVSREEWLKLTEEVSAMSDESMTHDHEDHDHHDHDHHDHDHHDHDHHDHDHHGHAHAHEPKKASA